MQCDRRTFLEALALTAGGAAFGALEPVRAGGRQASDIDTRFEGAVVVDALSVDPTWDDAVFAAARRSGVTAIHTSLDNRNLLAALRDLATWQKRFEQYPDRLLKVLSAEDIRRAKETRRVGVLLGFQNATMIETDLANLDTLYALGTRCIQLTYNERNLLGDGCTERTNAGLSDFGVAVVERMNALGIVVDLSHCGEATTWDAINLSRQPPAFTHTMCRALYDHVRAKSDAQLKALADKGGVVGIVMLGYFVGPAADTSLEDYLRHIDHAVKVAGIDHVGLASDYSLRGIQATATRESWYLPRLKTFKPSYRVRWPPWIPELDPPERYRSIAHGLARRGYSTAAIEKILGENWVRYFKDVFGR